VRYNSHVGRRPGPTEQGLRTRDTILRRAAEVASVEGLERLSIGPLAEELRLSKSGLFAHFGSKEELQLATIETARRLYVQEVIVPARAVGSGLSELRALCDGFLSYVERRVFPGGCFFASAMAEFHSRPDSPVRDQITNCQTQWLTALERAAQAAVERSQLRPGTDPTQVAFELEAALLSANWYFHLYRDTSYLRRARDAVRGRLLQDATPRGRSLISEEEN
jgi:AcrR family transcriptional regulator